MSDAEQATDPEVMDAIRSETALDIAAFRRFVFRVGDVDDDADIMEAAMSAADRIEEFDAQLQWLQQEVASSDGDAE